MGAKKNVQKCVNKLYLGLGVLWGDEKKKKSFVVFKFLIPIKISNSYLQC